MSMMSLHQALPHLSGARLIGDGNVCFDRVHTDTRSLAQGDLFVALRGDNFDAHSFLPQLKALGCVAVIAERDIGSSSLPGLEVKDSRVALGELAHVWRNQFSMPLIAVAGSNGKTTVTQLIASILAAWHGEDHRLATQGNFNNDVGLPLTLLRLRETHRAAVVEIGMNHVGEVPQLAGIAKPTVAVVNNAQREHQEFMGTVEATARENGAVLSALTADGIAVFPASGSQSVYAPIWRELAAHRRCVSFGHESGADLIWQSITGKTGQTLTMQSAWGKIDAQLPLLGEHNAHNAAAASAAALAAGAPIAAVVKGLEQFKPVKGRLVRSDYAFGSSHVALIDDTYNANPDSVLAAIDVLAQLSEPRWMVLGDMGEVGAKGAEFHAEVGAYARERGVTWLFGIGELCVHATRAFDAKAHADKRPHAAWFADRRALATALKDTLTIERPGSVLIKGSRFMKMEEFVEHTKQALCNTGGVAC